MPNGAGYVHARLTNADESTFVSVDDHKALVVIDYTHHEIHEGEYFSAFARFSGVADAGTRGILVRVPAQTSTQVHATFTASTEGDADAALYEAVTMTSAGTVCTNRNHYRDSTGTSGVIVTHTPGVTIGTAQLLANPVIPGGSKNSATGGSMTTRDEWILGSGKNYLLQLRNDSGGAADMSCSISWYE